MSHDHSHETGSRKRLAVVFCIVLVIFAFQVFGSIWTGSLALLVDTGHNSVDLIGLGIALFAATLVARPPKGQKTWGFKRAEVLAEPEDELPTCPNCGTLLVRVNPADAASSSASAAE